MKAAMKGRRVFYFSVFLLLALLLVGTMAFAEGNNSYTLTIRKVLPEGSPPEAFQQTYKFKVSGVVKSGDEKPFSKVVTITGPGEATVDIGNPYYVSAVETLDKLDIPGYKLDVNYSGSTNVPGQKAEVEITKDNGSITVSIADPEQAAAGVSYGYKITGPNGYEETIRVSGTEKKTVSGLTAGTYTVVQLGSAKGFSVAVDNRDIHVGAGETRQINIVAKDHGVLSVTAPNDDRTHIYTLKGPYGNNERETTVLAPGETYTSEHLSTGTYYASEKIYKGTDSFTVTVPNTKDKTVTKYKTSFTPPDQSTPKFAYYTTGGDYIDTIKYGPLYDNAGKKLTAVDTYTFCYGTLNGENKISYTSQKNRQGNLTYSSPRSYTPQMNRFYTSVLDLSSSAAYKLKIQWVEHTWEDVSKIYDKSDVAYKITIDDRGWLEISKPADTTPGAGQVTYSYTVTDSKGKKQTIELKAGDTKKVDGLAEGQCTVEQTVQTASPQPFTIRKQSYASASTAKAILTCALATADGQITISKPKPDSADLERVYHFTVTGPNGFAEQAVALKAGEEIVLTPGYAGEYSIYALDDEDPGFHLDFTNSCTIYSGKSEVVVTNSYVQAPASYNVVHEYYEIGRAHV